MNNVSKFERKSSIELLRIICMLLIIAHHYACHGGFDFINTPFSKKLFFVQCLYSGGKIGVNIFVLISGYFLCKTRFQWKKLLKLELEVIFYSIIIGGIFHIFYPEKESLENLIKEFTPLLSDNYWFYTAYFGMFLISPILNLLLEKLNKTMHLHIIISSFILWSIIPGVPKSNLLWFSILYFCGSYIRLYSEDLKYQPKTYLLYGLLLYMAIFIYIYISGKNNYRNNIYKFGNYDNFLIVIISILFFIAFSKIDIGTNKIINRISSATFGIYLIHDNNLIRPFLWISILKNYSYINSKFIILHSLGSILVVFVLCLLIDLLRSCIFEGIKNYCIKPLSLLLHKIN